ncbi:type II toxin-antitoxin system VapB family antitoxin [Propionimicrobium sp. PCR01-08-3]|uniref:type II toxin-antitoxin system VapB family antitoxin n=1 Tax=Propionimicrobium sp. PCR01-08-3 TaxID=3052086 RepID=UPI00255C77C5|nr:type II toxin-antitoxin system VapB family antitoxin [Propionimicrobium sp. PCR01-08-3]WIY81949.1 type II toxin-antitoxin system VapB family antitoxin [Propionimicrobium sp. PCR01-08-3]
MTKTLIDLDDELVQRAQEASGIRTKKGVVTAALEDTVRRAALDRYVEFVSSGALDDLADPQVTQSAQR